MRVVLGGQSSSVFRLLCCHSFTRRFLYQSRERQVGRRMVMTAEEANTASLHEYYVSFRSVLALDLVKNISIARRSILPRTPLTRV